MPHELEGVTVNWTRVNGWTVRYLSAGTKGPTVLLLHGGGLDAAHISYRHVIAPLGRSCRVIAPDWPGFGFSDPLPAEGWTSEANIKHHLALLDALGIDHAIHVGISMGGFYALGIALTAPQRVDKLVLINSGSLSPKLPGGVLSYIIIKLDWLNRFCGAMIVARRDLLKKMLKSGTPGHPEMITEDLVDDIMELAKRRDAGKAFRQWQREQVGWVFVKTPYLTRLGEIRVPTLFLHGELDNLVPVDVGRKAQKRVPGSRYLAVPKTGHLGPLESPNEFLPVMESFCLE